MLLDKFTEYFSIIEISYRLSLVYLRTYVLCPILLVFFIFNFQIIRFRGSKNSNLETERKIIILLQIWKRISSFALIFACCASTPSINARFTTVFPKAEGSHSRAQQNPIARYLEFSSRARITTVSRPFDSKIVRWNVVGRSTFQFIESRL